MTCCHSLIVAWIEQDLKSGKIDMAIVWGPMAGFLVTRHEQVLRVACCAVHAE